MRLSVTAVRPADGADLPVIRALLTDGVCRAAGSEQPLTRESVGAEDLADLLVLGQPALAVARVREVDGVAWLESIHTRGDLQVEDQAALPWLLTAAKGWAMDRGHASLLVPSEVNHEQTVPLQDEPLPLPAVSVLPLRDGPAGLEVFVQHRVSTMDFAAGAVVFPGGRVDPGDTLAGAGLTVDDEVVSRHAAAWAGTDHDALGGGEAAARTVMATARREVLEETGALIDPGALVPWDNWVTPPGYPRRFDVRFLVLPVAKDQGADFAHATTEAHHSDWTPLVELAQQAEAGRLHLMSPTRTMVDELVALGDLAAVLALHPTVRAIHHDTAERRPRPPAT